MSGWSTVAIYGVGLIGGSIGLALRKRKLAERVVGIGRNAAKLQRAVDLGAIDSFVTNPAEAPRPEIAVLCAPVQLLPAHCGVLAKHFPETLITDAGSTKQALVETIERESPQARFVGSHPMAGSERSGAEHGSHELFEGQMVILTPTANSNSKDVQTLTHFWQALGARTCSMDPASHDRALAITSHLPHVVSSALAAETPADLLHLIAGGWRDTTRIAGADVEMWTQILQENHRNVLDTLRDYQAKLKEFEQALESNQRESIERLLTAGKQRRDALGS